MDEIMLAPQSQLKIVSTALHRQLLRSIAEKKTATYAELVSAYEEFLRGLGLEITITSKVEGVLADLNREGLIMIQPSGVQSFDMYYITSDGLNVVDDLSNQ